MPLNIFTNLPSFMKAFPGLSSQPATNLPTITLLAPTASALHILPEYLFPPSEHRGTPYYSQIGAVSSKAVSWGTPLPATIRVMQMLPFPMPHRMPSAPLRISISAP